MKEPSSPAEKEIDAFIEAVSVEGTKKRSWSDEQIRREQEELSACFMDSLARITDVGCVARVVERVEQSLERYEPSFWTVELEQRLESYLLAQRVSHPKFYVERIALIKRLETVMGSDRRELATPKGMADLLAQKLLQWQPDSIEALEPFLDEVMVDTEVTRPLQMTSTTFLNRLAELGSNNEAFIEQMQALNKWGLINGSECASFIRQWSNPRIFREGLLFDPGDCRNFLEADPEAPHLSGALGAATEWTHDFNLRPHTKEELAETIKQFYFSEGFSLRCQEVIETCPVPLTEKYQLLKNLLHYGLFHVGTNHRFPTDVEDQDGDERDRPPRRKEYTQFLKRFYECTQRIPFTSEQKEALLQELHIAHYHRTGFFVDPVHCIPKMDANHPLVFAWRLEQAKQCLREYTTLTAFEEIEKTTSTRELINLPFCEWPVEEQERFILPCGTTQEQHAFLSKKRDPSKNKDVFAQRLMHAFAALLPESLHADEDDPGIQGLISGWDKIPEWCVQVPGFQDAYDRWMALRYEAGHTYHQTLSDLSQYPSMRPEKWSVKVQEARLEVFLEEGCWANVEELFEKYPQYTEVLQKKEKEYCLKKMKRIQGNIFSDDLLWVREFIFSKPALVEKIVAEDQEIHKVYQKIIARFYRDSRPSLDRAISMAPAIDRSLDAIQCAIADRMMTVLNQFLVKETPEPSEHPERSIPHWDWVQWESPSVKHSTHEAVLTLIREASKETALRKQLGVYRHQLEHLETVTGYSATDPYYLQARLAMHGKDLFSNTIDALHAWVEAWKVLHDLLDRPYDASIVQGLMQEKLDELCACGLSMASIRAFEEKYDISPSAKVIRQRIIRQLNNEGMIRDGSELLTKYKASIELELSEISGLILISPRAEAMVYTLMLPKAGKERLEAERLFRKRSDLADFIPDLLAIQSPSQRVEFCPYQEALRPLLNGDAFDLSDQRVRKGLLVFFKRFAMQCLPRLAQSVIVLVEKSEKGTKKIETRQPGLQELNEYLGVTEERLSLEEYFTRIEAVTEAMRASLLEDKPLDSRIERSAIGMELFNTVVPHKGSYQSTDDRPSLIAKTRVNKEKLTVESMYKTASFEIEVVHEKALEADTSFNPVDRMIRVQRELIEKKFQDEGLRKFLELWSKAFWALSLEGTGTSRSFWYGGIMDRWKKERAEREEQLLRVTKPEARMNLEKKIHSLGESIARMQTFIDRDRQGAAQEEPTPALLLEELQSFFLTPQGKVDRTKLEAEAGNTARGLCLVMMREHSMAHAQAVADAYMHRGPEEHVSVDEVRAWSSWFLEEYLQHFAQMKSDAQVPLSPSVHALFQKLWRIDGLQADIQELFKPLSEEPMNLIGHPIIDTFTFITQADKEIRLLEQQGIRREKKELTFWPSKGLGRVLSGDIANACFHNHREALAAGGYPNLTAILMTLSGRTEIAGSTLLIDAKTLSGKRALVIRALNPAESIVHELDADALVESTIAYAVQTAERQNAEGAPFIDEVRICISPRGEHSTNRQDIADAEMRLMAKYGWQMGDGLENSPETSFNNYHIWVRTQTRIVWKRKEDRS